MKRFISLFLASLLMLVALCGCTQESASGSSSGALSASGTEKDYDGTTIAVCMGAINHPVHRIVQAGFVTRGKELGYNAVVAGLDEGSIQELIAKYEATITAGAQGVLLFTGDDSLYEMMRDLVNQCFFVVPHFPHDYVECKSFISRNISALPKEYGEAAADYIVEKLRENGITSGSIGLTQNGPNVTENAASDAFTSRIEELGVPYTCLDVVFEGGEVSEAATKITGIIQSHPDIVAGFGTTGYSPQTWFTAMQNTSRTDLVVVGTDYTEYNQNLVKEGKISAIICQPLYEEGVLSAETLDDIFHGKSFSASEDEWFYRMEAPIARPDGEGTANINSYSYVVDAVKAFYNS